MNFSSSSSQLSTSSEPSITSSNPGTPVPIQPRQLHPHTTIPTNSFPNVYFVDPIQVFRCGYEGGLFHSVPNGITIKFPRGAVPENHPLINVQFGVVLNGPFEFPDESKPISPFVWFCTDIADFTFQKPVEIVLPHFLNADQSDCRKLAFMKASHNTSGDYIFKECTDTTKFRSRISHGVLLTTHTCFLCIAMKVSEVAMTKTNYCLVKVTPKNMDAMFNISFCVTYFLETCMEVSQLYIMCTTYLQYIANYNYYVAIIYYTSLVDSNNVYYYESCVFCIV